MSSGVVMGDTKIVGDVLLADETRTQPVVYLPMNEGTGNPSDESEAGNGFNGTLGGNADWTTDTFATAPCSIEFDGASDYINLGNSTTLAPNTALSLSIWALADDFGQVYQRMISRYQSGAGSPKYSYALLNGNGNGKVRFVVMQASHVGSGTTIETDDVVMTAGQWHHIVATYSGANTRMRIYVDGALVDTTISGNPASVPSAIAQGSINLSLGMNLDGSGAMHRSWDGKLDEFSLWDIELTADQVAFLYGNGTPPPLQKGIY